MALLSDFILSLSALTLSLTALSYLFSCIFFSHFFGAPKGLCLLCLSDVIFQGFFDFGNPNDNAPCFLVNSIGFGGSYYATASTGLTATGIYSITYIAGFFSTFPFLLSCFLLTLVSSTTTGSYFLGAFFTIIYI